MFVKSIRTLDQALKELEKPGRVNPLALKNMQRQPNAMRVLGCPGTGPEEIQILTIIRRRRSLGPGRHLKRHGRDTARHFEHVFMFFSWGEGRLVLTDPDLRLIQDRD